ncbi:MAG: DUF2905 domain-containing protein [Nitrospiraceae bacterium]|nr:MAG: DUF2905 domain-containing protein [Nitrospiraceae bacterium]
MQQLGRFLITFGIIIVCVGVLLLLLRNSGIPFLGKLPGDMIIQRKNFTFFFPLTTSILLSILLSLILFILFGRK